MLQKICIYDNKIFLVVHTHLVAYSYGKYLKDQSEKFLEYFKIKLPVKNLCENDTRLEVIEDYRTGLKSLIIVSFDLNKRYSIFIYNNKCRKKLYRIAIPNLSEAVEGYSFNLLVSHGPSFLFHSKDVFHMHSVPYGINNRYDCQFLLSHTKEYKILQFKSFNTSNNDYCKQLLFLLLISCNFPNEQRIKILGYVSESSKQIINCNQLSQHLFFPKYYESVLKTVQITKAVPILKSESERIKDVDFKETASIICTENDCLIFSNAILKYCCRLTLPVPNVMCIKAEFSSTFLKNVNLILTFENKTVFFMTVKRNLSFEVVKHWTNIEATIIGDVLMKGSKQVFLLKETYLDLDSWQKNCNLYDMSSFTPIGLISHNIMPDDSQRAMTISVLGKKVQIGKSAIKDIEYEISQKSVATIDGLMKLNEGRINNENLKCSNLFQESLIDLILSKDENKLEKNPVKFESSVKLLNKKQQFMDNYWIINLCFINDGERSICNPSFKVLIKNSQVSCIQKLFLCNLDNFHFSSEHNRQINPKTKFSIIISFKFSTFHMEDDVYMILSWYNGSSKEFDNDVFISNDKKVLIQNQMYIHTRIRLTDVLQYQVKRDISSTGDLLSIRALQQKIKLSISSLHSDIGKLEEVLMTNDSDIVCLNLFEGPFAKCMTFSNDKSLLFGVQLIVLKSKQDVVEVEVFSRNEKELCLLVHYLYQHLPEDIIICPCLKFKDEVSELKKDVVISIKDEIDMLLSSLNTYNISDEMRKSYEKLLSSQTVGTITVPKVAYQRIRTVLVKKECVTDTTYKSIS